MWVWDAGAPQLAIGVPQTGILPMFASLIFPTPLPSLCAARAYPLSLYLSSCCEACAVPCAWNQDVARDGRPCREQRPLLYARNPKPQPSCLAMVVAASLLSMHCRITTPISIASWPFHLFWAVTAYLGMVMPSLVVFSSLCYHHPLRYCFDHPRDKLCKH
jgi:hypothetical protein